MRKKLVTFLLLGMLMTAAACSGKDAEAVNAGTLPGILSAGNTAQSKATPEPKAASNTKATPEPQNATDAQAAPGPTSELVIEDCISSIKMPRPQYTFSCEEDKITFYYNDAEYGWLMPYEVRTWDGISELDMIIRNFAGASNIVNLIDTREEAWGTRYVLVTHMARYHLGEIEFMALAGILSEEEALAQEMTEVAIMYHLNGGQWWCFSTKTDAVDGMGLVDALEFEITFADI